MHRLPTSRPFAILLVLLIALGWRTAAALEPVNFPSPPDTQALVMIDGGSRTPVTLAQIEALGVYRVKTKVPWEDAVLTFEGVLLRDVLKIAGMESAQSIRVTATDDYLGIVPQGDWTDMDLLLATRQDGKLLDRDDKGPTQLIYPISDHPEFDTEATRGRWVWLIDRIERID